MFSESHVRRLEDRIFKIEGQHKNLTPTTTTPLASFPDGSHVPPKDRPSTSSLPPADHLYRGSSSFTTLSAEASETLQNSALSKTSEVASKYSEAFNHLDELICTSSATLSLQDHQFSPLPSTRPTPPIETLPVDLVVSVLRKIKGM